MIDILREKINEVMEVRIKNIHPATKDMILNKIDEFDSRSVKKIEEKIRFILDLSDKSSIRTKAYWIKRGWSEIDAAVKVKELNKNRPKRISPFSKTFWLDKINPTTGKVFTDSEAEYKRNSLRPIRKEYWLEKGYDLKDATRIADEQKIHNNKKGSIVSAERSIEEKRAFLHTSKDYWRLREYSEKEAESIISKKQSTFSLEICIEKYGRVEGTKRWSERQLLWKQSLKESGIYRGYSKISYELFSDISLIYPGYYGDNEFIISGNEMTVSVDFMYNNKVIEFYGDYWHANPNKFKSNDIIKNKKVSSIWDMDYRKKLFVEYMGYEVMIVWESDYKLDKKGTIDKCLHFLNQ